MAYGRKGDLAQRRSCLRAGRLHARRPADRAPARGARQDPLPGRLARLGQGRRHRSYKPPNNAQRSMTRHDAERIRPCNTCKPRLLRRRAARARARPAVGAPRVARRPFSPDQRGEIERSSREYLLAQSRAAAGGDGRAGEAPGRRPRPKSIAPRSRSNARDHFQFAAPGRRSATRRATSPWSSSSTTTAATASAPWPTCSTS